ncbi:sigma-70 family RNA polymerase sigma factor [Paraconexibacter sp. AEG42_29]|uniref:RNA polymerase sigma factor n=1 Tax=Paraconexibacter sp. AEG42_29 TaxID=2997339 RepID=UPI00339D79BA
MDARAVDFERVWQENLTVVHRFVTHMVRDAVLAEDITATAFERAWRHWDSFDPRRGRPSTWLCHIARNLAVDYLRRAGRTVATEHDALDRLAPASTDRIWEGLPPTMIAAVGRLSAVEREIVVMRVLLDFSCEEAAEVVGVSKTACSTYLSRALLKLRGGLPDLAPAGLS